MDDKIKKIEEYCRHGYAYFYSSIAKEHVLCLLLRIKELERDNKTLRHNLRKEFETIDHERERVKELGEGIKLLIDFIPDEWEVPLGWTVVVGQARKLIEKEKP